MRTNEDLLRRSAQIAVTAVWESEESEAQGEGEAASSTRRVCCQLTERLIVQNENAGCRARGFDPRRRHLNPGPNAFTRNGIQAGDMLATRRVSIDSHAVICSVSRMAIRCAVGRGSGRRGCAEQTRHLTCRRGHYLRAQHEREHGGDEVDGPTGHDSDYSDATHGRQRGTQAGWAQSSTPGGLISRESGMSRLGAL